MRPWREVKSRRGAPKRIDTEGFVWQVAASLIYGQVKKCYLRRKLVRVTHVMRLGTEADLKGARPRIGFLRTLEHGIY